MSNPDELKENLRHAINCRSAEGLVGNMPDFIAAELLFDVMCAVGKAVKARDEWLGLKLPPHFRSGPQPIVQQNEPLTYDGSVARDYGGHGR
jgi:hypothetical protein